jgi:hypothetical protein
VLHHLLNNRQQQQHRLSSSNFFKFNLFQRKKKFFFLRISDKQISRPIQTQRYGIDNNDEDLLILSLNESLNEKIPKKLITNKKSRINNNPTTAIADSEEQNLLKDIFFIC